MRIAIVNDTVMIVEMLRRVVTSVPSYDIAWVAYDGKSAIAYCAKDTPDLILMDMIMPEMDGVEVTRIIMQQSPCAILIVTADIKKNSAKVFEAMGHGALDVVSTPIMGISQDEKLNHALLKTIGSIGIIIGRVEPQWPSGSSFLLVSLVRFPVSPLTKSNQGSFRSTIPSAHAPSAMGLGQR